MTINPDLKNKQDKKLILLPVEKKANLIRSKLDIKEIGDDSDQLSLTLMYENTDLAIEYLNGLMYAFDYDGIKDRQLNYR